MTEQEQAVVDRLKQFVDEAAADYRPYTLPARNTLRAINILDLSPEECTVDVLRALWAIYDTFDNQGDPLHWAFALWPTVVAYCNQQPERWG